MNTLELKYKLLKEFNADYFKNDTSPKVSNFSVIKKLLNGDYSGINIYNLFLSDEDNWVTISDSPGLGVSKIEKLNLYRKDLEFAWNKINIAFETNNENDIARIIGKMLWDLKFDSNEINLLILLEKAIKENKLWKSQYASSINCNYFGFIENLEYLSLSDIGVKYEKDKETIRLIKEKCLDSFEQDFWIVKTDLFKDKLKLLFLIESNLNDLSETIKKTNQKYQVNFSNIFYKKVLSQAFNIPLLGNINDINVQSVKSETRNIWSDLYLIQKETNHKINIGKLLDSLTILVNKTSLRIEEDIVITYDSFCSESLTLDEMIICEEIINEELAKLSIKVKIKSDEIRILRNTQINYPEMIEIALAEMGGIDKKSKIKNFVEDMFPNVDWDISFNGAIANSKLINSIGKKGLFYHKQIRPLEKIVGDGNVFDIIKIYLEKENKPKHLFELRTHINNIYDNYIEPISYHGLIQYLIITKILKIYL